MQTLRDYLLAKNLLWSYDPARIHDLPDALIIEQVLVYGDVPQLAQLFVEFPKETIRSVWEQKLLPQAHYRKINYYLAIFYFDIKGDVRAYIDHFIQYETRIDKLQRLAAENS